MAPSATPSNSGIRKLSNGESVIPSSKRADGSVRKEIRVKPGYKPPEDVEVYKNRTAESWKNRGKGGVPGAQVVGAEERDAAQNAASVKNAKRKEARKKAAAAANTSDGRADATGGAGNDSSAAADQNQTVDQPAEELDPEAEKAKEARKLAKKLRQARDLKEKKESGGDLLPEQFAKVIKMNELIRQLDNLGFTADGEKKGQIAKTPDVAG